MDGRYLVEWWYIIRTFVLKSLDRLRTPEAVEKTLSKVFYFLFFKFGRALMPGIPFVVQALKTR